MKRTRHNQSVKEGTDRADIGIGTEVVINPQKDKTRKMQIEGTVDEVLSNTSHHSHGILVRLKSGDIGRVKKIKAKVSASASRGIGHSDNHIEDNNDVRPIPEILGRGEDHFSEFKSSMLWSERLTPEQIKKSNSADVKQYGRSAAFVIIAKTIAGFLNSDGGTLLIGVKENKDTNDDEVIGVESEFSKLKDSCADGYRRKILDSVIKQYLPAFVFNHFNNYLKIEFCEIESKQVCVIRVNKSDAKVFINLQNKDRFFVRIDASTRELTGEEIVDYCIKRFV